EVEGLLDTWKPDPDTRLCAWFETSAAPWVPARVLGDAGQVAPDAEADAVWRADRNGIHLEGPARGLATRCSSLEPDGPESGFGKMGIPGSPELRFSFQDAPPDRPLVVRITWQQGARSWLPHEGQATASVACGRETHEISPTGISYQDVTLRFDPREPGE